MNSPILFIIGAPRSGTNILRDTILTCSDFYSFSCDEINPLWRIGIQNNQPDTFNFPPSVISKYRISRAFRSLSRKNSSSHHLVEKTCANSLRLKYVLDIFPCSKILYIRRSPHDCIASIVDRWLGSTKFRYLLKKAKYLPVDQYHLYAWPLLQRVLPFKPTNYISSYWGPILPNTSIPTNYEELLDLAASQWFYCNKHATEFINKSQSINYTNITYEDFATNPTSTLLNALNCLGYDLHPSSFSFDDISPRSIGKCARNQELFENISKSLNRLGFS